MRRVIVESPYAADTPAVFERHLRYLCACLSDCLKRSEAAFASHAMYTTVLNDNVPAERKLGIEAGFAWREVADATVVYRDLGVSAGMVAGVDHAVRLGQCIEWRELGPDWDNLGAPESTDKWPPDWAPEN